MLRGVVLKSRLKWDDSVEEEEERRRRRGGGGTRGSRGRRRTNGHKSHPGLNFQSTSLNFLIDFLARVLWAIRPPIVYDQIRWL